jgi:hypothetical protein
MLTWQVFRGSPDEWDSFYDEKSTYYTQMYVWGEFKKNHGWSVLRLIGSSEEDRPIGVTVFYKSLFFWTFAWCPGLSPRCMNSLDGLFSAIKLHLRGRYFYLRVSFCGDLPCLGADDLIRKGWLRPRIGLGAETSFLMTLSSDQAQLLAGMTANWRHNLRRSARDELDFKVNHTPDASELADLYNELARIKRAKIGFSEGRLKEIFNELHTKLISVSCYDKDSNLVSYRAAIVFNTWAFDFLAVSGYKARKNYATYGVLWRLLACCVQAGATTYDLGGADIGLSEGVFNFKKGTGARQIQCGGEFEKSTISVCTAYIGSLVSRARGSEW